MHLRVTFQFAVAHVANKVLVCHFGVLQYETSIFMWLQYIADQHEARLVKYIVSASSR